MDSTGDANPVITQIVRLGSVPHETQFKDLEILSGFC